MEESDDPGLFLSLLGRTHHVEPDPIKVQQLVEMGFVKENAE